MDVSYYPGCTLKTKAKNLEDSALASMTALGVNMIELPRWNCCGAVCSLAEDDLVHHLAPVRNLARAKETGKGKLVTLCSSCYNILKRADLLMKKDKRKSEALNTFMDEEVDYNGEVQVVHLLELLRDDIGWQAISEHVKVPLNGLKLASYYGCTLLRPKEVAIDDMGSPIILDSLLKALGSEVVDFPLVTECCGSFQIVSGPEQVIERAWSIINSARNNGAEALVLTCPLCAYNLGQKQVELKQKHSDFQGMPVFYFTQLLAISLGLSPEVCHFELNFGNPEMLLKSKNLLP